MDSLIHAIAADGNVRITAVCGTELVKDASLLHRLSRVATAALGRQLMMTVMMGSQLKNAGDKVTTILKGDGPAGNMVCTADNRCFVKGYTSNPLAELPPTPANKLDVGGYVGHSGQLTVIRDLPVGEPYVGICDLISGEIAIDFAQYYAVSEQQPSIVYLGVRLEASSGSVRSGAGLLVQPMPGCPDEVLDALEKMAQEFPSLSTAMDAGCDLEQEVLELFAAWNPEITDRFVPVLRCDCSRERIERSLIALGAEELNAMCTEDHGAEITCHFCNSVYRFTEEDLRALLGDALQ